MLLSNIEGCVQVLQWIVLGQFGIVDQVRSMAMDQSAEGQTILWKSTAMHINYLRHFSENSRRHLP